MNKDELTKQLKQPFTDKALGGVQKLDLAGWENIFFVIPHHHPKSSKENFHCHYPQKL